MFVNSVREQFVGNAHEHVFVNGLWAVREHLLANGSDAVFVTGVRERFANQCSRTVFKLVLGSDSSRGVRGKEQPWRESLKGKGGASVGGSAPRLELGFAL